MSERLTNTRTGAVLADRVTWARSPAERARGLIGSTLEPGEALVLRPAKQVHTFFMTQTIDVVFCDGTGDVIHLCRMPPWRVSRFVIRADLVIELPAGRAAGLRKGDRLGGL